MSNCLRCWQRTDRRTENGLRRPVIVHAYKDEPCCDYIDMTISLWLADTLSFNILIQQPSEKHVTCLDTLFWPQPPHSLKKPNQIPHLSLGLLASDMFKMENKDFIQNHQLLYFRQTHCHEAIEEVVIMDEKRTPLNFGQLSITVNQIKGLSLKYSQGSLDINHFFLCPTGQEIKTFEYSIKWKRCNVFSIRRRYWNV